MNQHYVPRCYLKHFADFKGKEYFVDVYDKIEKRFFKTNIKKICSEINFYTLKEDNLITKDLFSIEKVYSQGFEPLFIKSYEILTNHNIFHITQQQRIDILLGIFQMYVRNPIILKRRIAFHKIEILKLFDKSKNEGLKGITYLEEDFSFREWTKEGIVTFIENKLTQEYKENHIGGIGQVGSFHENAILEINLIKDDSEFMTSDNPLIFVDSISKNEHPLLRSNVFTIALNRKITLRMYHDNTKQLNRIYRCFIPNGSVEMINKDILNQSSRFVLTNKMALGRHNSIAENFLDNTSPELIIDALKQIILKFPITSDNKEATEILKKYLDRHEKEGGLTQHELFEMHIEIQKVKIDFINKRIK